MKNMYSFLACILIIFALLSVRVKYSNISSERPLQITTWDAFGYYMYLPSIFIYQDITELNWLAEIDAKYKVTGGYLYQAHKIDNGNYVFHYLGGVAILQTPFFLLGHLIAKHSAFEADGFSPPYQFALAFGVLFYCFLAIFLLRHILLKFFSDQTTAITMILLLLATNFIQYASIDNAMSHAYIFPLYVLVLYSTIKWHQSLKIGWASLTGFIIGLATICRPTEAIMVLIPILWNTQTKEIAKEKWTIVKKHKNHIIAAAIFGFIGILPQLIYWKYSSGSFVYEVGSAWDFLTPHLRVIIGWEKGWFIYTPVTIFFIIGLFYVKKYPFRKAVIYFCLVNIYIIISWRDWKYGASYSTRALVQSYPIFALAFAALIEKISQYKWRYAFYALGLYLLAVNFFQIVQYNYTFLHYNQMNRRYYGRIYLNSNITPIDVSLLDTKEWLRNENKYNKEINFVQDSILKFSSTRDSSFLIANQIIDISSNDPKKLDVWFKIESDVLISKGFYGSYLNSKLVRSDSMKLNSFRIFNPFSSSGESNKYAFYVFVPEYFQHGQMLLYLSSEGVVEGSIENTKITLFKK